MISDFPELPEAVLKGESEAFDMTLVREAEMRDTNNDVRQIYKNISEWVSDTFKEMKTARQPFERGWKEAEEAYSMDEALQGDGGRGKSIFIIDPDKRAYEEEGFERSDIVMPVAHEAVEIIVPRYYESLFGNDNTGFVEVVGREPGDDAGAQIAQDLLNYQHTSQIDTPYIGTMFCKSAVVYGVGYLWQHWDAAKNRRISGFISPWNIWVTPGSENAQSAPQLYWRQTVKIHDIQQWKAAGHVDYLEKELASAAEQGTGKEHFGKSSIYNRAEDLDPNQTVYLDIMMDRDRWIYRVNESLIIAVQPNILPSDPKSDVVQPIVSWTPIPKLTGENEIPSVYGISHLVMGKDIMDMVHSINYLMHSNLARSALGITFYDPVGLDDANAMDGIRAGDAIPIVNPKENIYQMNFPDISIPCMNVANNLQGKYEKLFGINDSFRGIQSYSTQTATGQQRLMEEATSRLVMAIKLGVGAMTRYIEAALRLNQAYMENQRVLRITGEENLWKWVEAEDIMNVSGVDLVPTGHPLAGSKLFMAQQGLNVASVLAQFKAQGINARPEIVAREALKAMGMRGINRALPEEKGMGFDPVQENERMLEGQAVMVSENDNDENHLNVHMPLLFNPETVAIIKQTPGLLEAIQMHVSLHTAKIEGNAQGMGGVQPEGAGMPGLNTQMPTAQPKQPEDLEAQINAG